MTSINNGYLLGLYGGSYDASTSTGLASTTSKKAQPTAPWSTSVVAPKADAMVRAALGGRNLINEDAAQVDVKGASGDYKKLFAMYQALETLNALSNRAATKGVSASESALLAKRFTSGLAEVSSYLSTAAFEDVRMVQGTTGSISKTTAAVPRDSAISITGPIHEGAIGTPVAAFQGDVAFDITIRVPAGLSSTTKAVPIDLAQMGSTPRTIDNVTGF
ncbi:MAG: transcriptional regulator, partial [Caulobacteraceae bacterium]